MPAAILYWMQRVVLIFFSSRRRHTRFDCDWSSDVCSSDLPFQMPAAQNNRSVIPNQCDLKIRESQRTHLLARVVVFLVTVHHGLPAAVDKIGRASCRERV